MHARKIIVLYMQKYYNVQKSTKKSITYKHIKYVTE